MTGSQLRAAALTYIIIASVVNSPAQAQQPAGRDTAAHDTAALQRMLVAEDLRGHGSAGVTPMLDGLASRDPLLRRVAVRGLGRLQRPDLGRRVLPSLVDPAASVRAEAANAIAQSLRLARRGAPPTDTAQLTVAAARAALLTALSAERSAPAADAMAESLGRLPYADSAEARPAMEAITERARRAPGYGAVHGLYTLALARRFVGNPSAPEVELLRQLVLTGGDPAVRRLAVLTLAVGGALDSGTTLHAARDADEQVRRLALRGVSSLDPAARAAVVAGAFADASPIVRVDAIGAARFGSPAPDCGAIIRATGDAHPYVALVAIDSLGAPCRDPAGAAQALARIVTARRTGLPDHAWQRPARALLALARIAPRNAAAPLSSAARAPRWQERAYAARAAAAMADTALLYRLAADSNANVREAAVTGLAQRVRHGADSVYVRVIGSAGYQAVLAAAQALAGTPDTAAALPAMLDALDRLTRARSENARDPRLMLLRRIGELGGSAALPRLEPYLADFDTSIATGAAGLISRWSGKAAEPRPAPLPIAEEPLAAVLLAPDVRFRVTMAPESGGGTFTVRLLTADAPATAAHLIRLARSGYYNGLVLHRVEPNFVVQGGGPGATEYIGDTVFMRDEVAWQTHARGTIGISSRGRDTGDAQWFINLVDNPLLDHEYTVFGRIIEGRPVAERIVEGDRISRMEVIGAPEP
jgi:cyclophilin family peptidyl-prolyl cis-trans isomerase